MPLNDSATRAAISFEEGTAVITSSTTSARLPRRNRSKRGQKTVKADLIKRTQELFKAFKKANGGV